MDEYALVERLPNVEEYRALRHAVGWRDVDYYAAQKSLRNSLYGVCVLHGEMVIGCGRVIGDGGLCFYIQDIMVSPLHQGQGLGRRMMDNIMHYLKENAHQGSFAALMAARGAASFYHQYGFFERPTQDYGPGMSLFW